MKNIKTLKFWAPWCKPCASLSTQLEGLDVTNYNIDESEGSTVAAEFQIRNIPALVFLEVDENGKGKEIYRHVGVISRKDYLDTVDALVNGKVNPEYQELVQKFGTPKID